jgi:2-succinyl-5-enolpyruvyl-6-hydroxy-3-cyclohexene-1-carboxylate synthase
MRFCASGQTIDQQGMFGRHVNFFHELAMPETTDGLLRYLRQTIAHACTRDEPAISGGPSI